MCCDPICITWPSQECNRPSPPPPRLNDDFNRVVRRMFLGSIYRKTSDPRRFHFYWENITVTKVNCILGCRTWKWKKASTFFVQLTPKLIQVLSLFCQLGNCSVSILRSFSARWFLISFGVESSAFKRAAIIRCPETKMCIRQTKQCIMQLSCTKRCYYEVPITA